ncbi:MAG TPA: adenylosuccinate synthase [Phycisphaerales bacterium]|nr:adenylosuccinate synthase [Phycisphaerales bacterium]
MTTLSIPSASPARPSNPRAAEPSTAVVGLQWGDEGKGKVIDLLAPRYGAVVRYNGGANAGHSVVIEGKRHALHLMPSGVFHPGVQSVIGNGVVIDPEVLLREIDQITTLTGTAPALAVSDRAHVVMPWHKVEDAIRETLLATPASGDGSGEGDRSIGTTKRGIGPAYADKAHRAPAVRVGDLLRPASLRTKIERVADLKNRSLAPLAGPGFAPFDGAAIAAQYAHLGERLRPFVTDTLHLLHGIVGAGRAVLFEGANATLLDVDHGTFPFVTSSSCSTLGIPVGTGLPCRHVQRVVGVMKAYSTRVGGGPFPTELKDATGDRIRERGREYGTTTGRPRRCGWLDLVALRYTTMLNGATGLAIMLLDVLAGLPEIKVCTAYEIGGERVDRFPPDAEPLALARPVFETLAGFDGDLTVARTLADLPAGARRYVEFIERALGVPAEVVSVGPDRAQTIVQGE